MNALSIIIVFLILWVALLWGIVMAVASLSRLRAYWVTSPMSVTSVESRKKRTLAVYGLLLAFGLFLAFWGIFGTYSLIWAA